MSIKSIKVISRNPDHYMRETKHDLHRVPRNYDPNLHPFSEAREYKEALNAVKLERVFAKPFVGSLTHSESVTAMCRHPNRLSCIYTGTSEGELAMWNLQNRRASWKTQAHDGQIHCISSVSDGETFFTVGNDKTIKQWSVDAETGGDRDLPKGTWFSDTVVTGITHHKSMNEFITCGQRVLLWDITSKAPKTSFDWQSSGDYNEGSVVCVKLNRVERNIFASSDHANNIIIYDIRDRGVKKVKMNLRINALDWNPMESFILTAASEDYNCYSFDIRKMDQSNRVVGIHKGHTSAVTDICYSPTGEEFVSGSYDKSLRIFKVEESNSRDVYHTKRMFRIGCVLWTADNKYVLSGSSDHNLRIWKAEASEKLGIMRQREKEAINYAKELRNKYKHFPEVRRISRHRHLPKYLYTAKKEQRILHDKAKRKEHNVRTHSRPGSVPFVPVKQKAFASDDDPAPGTSNCQNDSS